MNIFHFQINYISHLTNLPTSFFNGDFCLNENNAKHPPQEKGTMGAEVGKEAEASPLKNRPKIPNLSQAAKDSKDFLIVGIGASAGRKALKLR